MRLGLVVAAFCAALCIVVPAAAAPPVNVDISRRHTNESEETIAVNPTNPNNIVEVSNVDFPEAGMLEGVSFDGGQTWTTKLIGSGGKPRDAGCEPSLFFHSYGDF